MHNKKMISILLLGAVIIILFMLALVLTANYKSDTVSPSTLTLQSPEASIAPQIPFVSASPSNDVSETDQTSTPIAVVRNFFDLWNAKDESGMDALWVASERGKNTDAYMLSDIDTVDLNVCIQQSNDNIPSGFLETFSSASEMAYVVVAYDIHYNEKGQQDYMQETSTREDFQFLLIKQNENDPWLIAAQGY